MRTSREDLNRHIRVIEDYTEFRIERAWDDGRNGKRSLEVTDRHGKVVAVIKSSCMSDIWDMLQPFWEIASYAERGVAMRLDELSK